MVKDLDAREKPVKCAGIKKGGARCTNAPMAGSRFCWVHDPDAVDARREASRLGGKAKSNASRARKHLPSGLLTTDDLLGLVGLTLRGVLNGKVEPGVGNAVFAGARTYVAVQQATDQEERLAALEALSGRKIA